MSYISTASYLFESHKFFYHACIWRPDGGTIRILSRYLVSALGYHVALFAWWCV